MSESSSRPLAAAAGPHRRNFESLPPPRRKENVSTACFACKTRKSKCSGGQPCNSCVRHGTECVIDEQSDLRRRIALKRKVDDLEQDRELLLRLVSTLREGDNHRLIRLLTLIRNNASLEEIRSYLEKQLSRGDLEQTMELEDVWTEIRHLPQSEPRTSRHILDAKRLSDVPLWKVPAKPWTRLTDDDDFVSHLVSLWFTWYQPTFNWVDRSLFIRDMQAGNLDCEFCSQFLVNIILANACAYSDYPEAYSNRDDPTSRGFHFYREAKRLYEEEEGTVTLTTVQGLGILWVCACLLGKDRAGWVYQGQVAFAVHEFASTYPPASAHADKGMRELDGSRDRTIWGIYNIMTATSMSYQKTPLIKIPNRSHMQVDHERADDRWISYPSQRDELDAHTACVLSAQCDMSVIIHEISTVFYSKEEKISASAIQQARDDLYSRLLTWEATLPTCINSHNPLLPQVLSLHMCYHATIMTLLGSLTDLVEGPVYGTSDAARRAKNICLDSARQIAHLVGVHRDTWGLERVPTGNIQWMTVALLTLMKDLDSPQNREAFSSLCVAQRVLTRRWALSRGMLRLVQLTAKRMEVDLPHEARTLFEDFESQTWDPEEEGRFNRMYPSFAAAVNNSQSVHNQLEPEAFLKSWVGLQIS